MGRRVCLGFQPKLEKLTIIFGDAGAGFDLLLNQNQSKKVEFVRDTRATAGWSQPLAILVQLSGSLGGRAGKA